MVMQKMRRMLIFLTPSEPPEETKRDDEARAREKNSWRAVSGSQSD
jgi:hypothetical protein